MAIFTRFGSEVEIASYNHNTGDVEIFYPKTGHTNYVAPCELKADGGAQEIEEAINEAKG